MTSRMEQPNNTSLLKIVGLQDIKISMGQEIQNDARLNDKK